MRATAAAPAPKHGRLSGSICFVERFMWSSALEARLEFLASQAQRAPLPAWKSASFSSSPSLSRSLDVLYNGYTWEREPFHAALR